MCQRRGLETIIEMRIYLLIGIFLVLAGSAYAGGSSEAVLVDSLSVDGSNYVLVVLPQRDQSSKYQDPYMGGCESFTVHGSYDTFRWIIHNGPDKQSHMSALSKLKEALANKSEVQFGWLGQGFKRVEADSPCLVESKGLELKGEAIYSRYKGS